MEPLYKYILSKLEQAGFESYMVGGCVRDTLLHREFKDIDIATAATPEQVSALFPCTQLVGAAFGVILVKEGVETVEVATFRKEGQYIDHRHPTEVTLTTDLMTDLRRRDFTINALVMTSQGYVSDYVGGRTDLEEKRIRTVGDPKKRFFEDSLRMLRAIRFACQLDFTIDPETFAAIIENAMWIQSISAERVQAELNRILTSGHADMGFYWLKESGLLPYIEPMVAKMVGVQQNAKYHPEGDVFTHTMRLLRQLPQDCSLTLALAALLHDVGKPATFALKNGQPTFHGHEDVGADMVPVVLGRLKYPNEVIEVVTQHVADHMRFRTVKEMRQSKLYRFVRQPHFAELLELHRIDSRAGAGDLSDVEFVEQVLNEVPPEVIRPVRLVTGHDLIAAGLQPGPRFGTILDNIEELQLDGELRTKEEALAFALLQWRTGYIPGPQDMMMRQMDGGTR